MGCGKVEASLRAIALLEGFGALLGCMVGCSGLSGAVQQGAALLFRV